MDCPSPSAPLAMRRPDRRSLRRRALFAGVVASATFAMTIFMLRLLGGNGLDAVDLVLLALLVVALPWLLLGFANALIGLVLEIVSTAPARRVLPAAGLGSSGRPVRARTAILVPAHNEDCACLFAHLGATLASLEATGAGDRFELFLLSDTSAALAAEEQQRFAEWRARAPARERLHYRHRPDNHGHKLGNLWDFLDRRGTEFEFFLVLDGDSLMSGDAVLRLVRIMEASPEIGILQHLTVGLPNRSPFARLFQFGMRHGLRVYTLGAAWWQGDSGSYWGHNALIRSAPFIAHCRLPELPGMPPAGGRILSHDQVEAVLMRRAGFEVRLLCEEDGSYELSPPTVVEFIKRDLRWGQGNLQYARVLRCIDARGLGRLQLLQGVLMYLNSPAWVAFILVALGREWLRGAGLLKVEAGVVAGPLLGQPGPYETWLMLAAVLSLTFAPKLAGLARAIASQGLAAPYGGRWRLAGSAAAELVFSLALMPLMLLAQTRCAGSFLLGRRVHWGAQLRSPRSVRWPEAWRSFWLEVVVGAALIGTTLALAPGLLAWAALLGVPLLLAPAFAVVTASAALGERLARAGLCATPEEREPPAVVEAAGYIRPAGSPRTGARALLPADLGTEQQGSAAS